MFGCDICERTFTRRDNLNRHKHKMHRQFSDDDEDSRSSVSSDDTTTGIQSRTDDDGTDNSREKEDEDDSNDPWEDIVDMTFKKYKSKFVEEVNKLTEDGEDKEDAREEAYDTLGPLFRKDIASRYLNRMIWFGEMKQDPIHKKIKETAKRLMDDEDYDEDEAWKYAVKKRKFLMDKILKSYNPPTVN